MCVGSVRLKERKLEKQPKGPGKKGQPRVARFKYRLVRPNEESQGPKEDRDETVPGNGDSNDASAPVEGLRAANAEIRFMFSLWAKQVYLSKGKPRKNTLANTLSL